MEQQLTSISTAENVAAAPLGTAGRILAAIRSLGPGRLLAVGTILLGFVGFFAFAASRAFEPDYALLYAGLKPEDSQVITQRLQGLGVPFRLSDGADAIMVPQDQIGRLRMELATDGMPGGSVVGYEIFDQSSGFGQTDFLSNVNLRRALEGELARSIGTLRPVQSARVHIVQPERSLFRRDEAKPTASVVLSLRGGASVDARQVQAIRNLVASAVPGLEPASITIVDDRGNLLARPGEGGENGVLPAEADDMRTAYEARLKQKIVQLLERSVGPGHVDAEVTVEMNFDQVTTTAETFDPQSQVARSTQTVEEQSDRNQNNSSGAVSVGNNLPTAQPAAGPPDGDRERNSRNEETVNFEISRTVRNEVQRPGGVKRLSIAVQVDGSYATKEDGSTDFQPRPADELAQLEALAKSASGFDEARGDVFQIASRRFVGADIAAGPEPGWLEGLGLDAGRLINMALLALMTLAVLFFGVRPLVGRLLPAAAPVPAIAGMLTGPTGLLIDERPRLDGPGVESDQAAPPALPTGADDAASPRLLTDGRLDPLSSEVHAALLKDVGRIVEERPQDAVKVIRAWLGE